MIFLFLSIHVYFSANFIFLHEEIKLFALFTVNSNSYPFMFILVLVLFACMIKLKLFAQFIGNSLSYPVWFGFDIFHFIKFVLVCFCLWLFTFSSVLCATIELYLVIIFFNAVFLTKKIKNKFFSFIFQGIAGFAIALTCSSLRRKDDALHIRQIIGWLLTLFPFLIITIYFFHKVIQEFSKKDDLKAAEVS